MGAAMMHHPCPSPHLGDAHGGAVARGDVAAQEGALEVRVGVLLHVHHAVSRYVCRCVACGVTYMGTSAAHSDDAQADKLREKNKEGNWLSTHPPMKAVLFWKVDEKS